MHDGKRSSMTHDRIRVLETMGFEWRSPKDAAKRKPDGVSRENGMFDMSDQASPGSSGMKRNRMHEQSGMMMLPPGAYGASSGPMSGMPHMPGSAAMQYGGYGAYGPPSVHSQMMYPPAAHGRMQNYPMSMSMNMMQPMGASDGHQQQEQQHFMTGMNGNAASAGQLPLPNQTMTWMCQFCRCSYYGTYMDLRTHEAQCGGWRSYYGSQAGPPQPGHGQTHSANVNVSPNSA